MRTTTIATVSLALWCAIGPGLAVSGCGSSQEQQARIELLARAPERGNWSPQTIRVERGEPVTFVIRNVDTVTHGFYLPDLGLNTGEIQPGETREITFKPDVAGEFTFMCSVWCSDHHMHMTGVLIVE